MYVFLFTGHSSFYALGASRSSDGLSTGSGSLTADELKRLDEVRRSFRLDHNEYPPDLPPKTRNQNNHNLSGITADYRDVQQYRYVVTSWIVGLPSITLFWM